MKRLRGYEIGQIMLGRIFRYDPKGITTQPCWLAECVPATEDDFEEAEVDWGDEEFGTVPLDEDCCDPYDCFVLPIMPTLEERRYFAERRGQCQIDMDFLERQNGILLASGTPADEFFEKLPEFDEATEMDVVLELITKYTRNKHLYKVDNHGDPFPRHLYLASAPGNRILFLEFDDGAYRPEMRQAEKRLGRVEYKDFVTTARSWKIASQALTEAVFSSVSEEAINALNDGLSAFRRVNQSALPSQHQINPTYRIFNHIIEVCAMPAIWVSKEGQVTMYYDLLGDWRSGDSGEVKMYIGEFMIQHTLRSGQCGEIHLQTEQRVLEH